MAAKRAVSIDFWRDSKVVEQFTPEDKLFMLYLLTNPNTTQLGIYELPVTTCSRDLGYDVKTIQKLFKRFEEYGIAKRSDDTNEVAIKNYLVYSITRGGKPLEDCIETELKRVKDKSLVDFVFGNLQTKDNLNQSVKNVINRYLNKPTESTTTSLDAAYWNNFNIIYNEYPRKDGKNNAFLHYKSWHRGRIVGGTKVRLTDRQMYLAVQCYAKEVKENQTDRQFIQMASTFFNNTIAEYVEKYQILPEKEVST